MRPWLAGCVACAITVLAAGGAAASPTAYVFPVPGSRMAMPSTQIAFRGLPVSALGSIQVSGSQSGVHAGAVRADSDGQGASFIPAQPFLAGETVTVTTTLNIVGAQNGTFQFTVATPAAPGSFVHHPTLPRIAGDVWQFRSRPDLTPAAVTFTMRSSRTAPGDIFLGAQRGPLQYGPEIVDSSGNLVWFKPLPGNLVAMDVRVQHYQGHPVLTWWQGQFEHGHGSGQGVIDDTAYRQIATVQAANGLSADEHEFELTPHGTALVDSFNPVVWDASSVGGSSHEVVLDGVAQEIDIPTGLVLFQWDSLDHVPLSSSYLKPPHGGGFDYFHINAIEPDKDGNFVISSRNTSAAYKVNSQTGAIMWTLGGKQSSFKMGPGASFAFQHDVRVRARGDRYVTTFDDEGGPPRSSSQSRGLKLRLDLTHMTATLVTQYEHAPPLAANYQGNDQQLPNLDDFVGWGQGPVFSEFTRTGQLIFDGRFVDNNSTYRAYRFPWSAQPTTAPALAVTRGADGVSSVYASWNGATSVASWRVLAGPSASSLAAVATVPRSGFETAIAVHNEQPFFEVQALGSAGQTLASSSPSGTSTARISIFGHTAFIPPGGLGGLNVGCFSTQTCHVTATVSAGATTIARTGSESLPAGTGGIVFFKLTSAGRTMLAHASRRRLAATATVLNVDGASNTTKVTLIPYRTSGKSPQYRVTQSPSLQVIPHTAFVSPGGVAGLFAACVSVAPCHVKTTIKVGSTVVARTGTESIAGQDCGILFFKLTPAGRATLANAGGKPLGAQVTAVNGPDTVQAQLSLVQFS